MKYLEEFRDAAATASLADLIARASEKLDEIRLMEVCGTHTMAIARFGLKSIIPDNIKLISGPGCPVCVSPHRYIDASIAYCRRPNTIITTFGDMVRVPGSSSSLEKESAEGADVRVVFSTMDALRTAEENPESDIIFLGVGFETTAPTIAGAVVEAKRKSVDNFAVLCGHKVIPPAMAALAGDPEVKVDGYICPPHVSAIIGSEAYRFLAEDYSKACCVAGFEPLDILQGVLWLVEMIAEGAADVKTQYSRVVGPGGNPEAIQILNEVFEPCDDDWRGIGTIPMSGLGFREVYYNFDAERRWPVEVEKTIFPKGCICGLILMGVAFPTDCKLFGKKCTPEHPVGACMVSSEGSCAASYKYSNL